MKREKKEKTENNFGDNKNKSKPTAFLEILSFQKMQKQ